MSRNWRHCNAVDPIVASHQSEGESAPALSEVSPKDKPWDKHRANTDIVAHHYKADGMDSYSERVNLCSQLLDFKLVPDREEGELKLKLSSAYFCRVRHCPVCQWRRSLKWRAKALAALPKLIEDYPKLRYLFLTLTLRNYPITELRAGINDLNYGFRKLCRRKVFPGIGWLKSLEVTQGQDRFSAHPHLHVLIAVKSTYFSFNYLSQEKWCELWQRCLKVDYKPILHIKAIKPNNSLQMILNEVIKYQVKESDLVRDPGWFAELVRQMHGTRAVALGGIFKDYFKELEEEPVDLIGHDQDSTEVDEGHLFFGWRSREKLYRQVDI